MSPDRPRFPTVEGHERFLILRTAHQVEGRAAGRTSQGRRRIW